MPLLSGIVPAIRVAVSSIVGALMLIIPVAPGAGAAHHRATAVGPPASTRVAQSTGLFATACVAAGSCTAGGNFGGAGRPLEPMIATQAHGRWSRGIPLLLPPTPRPSRTPRSPASPAIAPGTAWRSATTSTAGPATCRPSWPSSPTGDGRAHSRHASRRTPPPHCRPSLRPLPAPATDPATRWAPIRTRPATRRPWWWPSRRRGPGARPVRSHRRRTRPRTRTP